MSNASFSTTLAQTDYILDAIPVVSTVTNLVDIFIKVIVIPNLNAETIEKSHYYSYLSNKKLTTCLAFMLPVVNLVMKLYNNRLATSSSRYFALASPREQSSPRKALEAIKTNPNAWDFVPYHLKNNQQFMLNATRENPLNVNQASNTLRNTQAFWVEVVKLNRSSLYLVPQQFQAALFASPFFKRNYQFWVAAIKLDTTQISNVPPSFIHSRLLRNLSVWKWTKRVEIDALKKIICKVVQQEPGALNFAPNTLLDDQDFILSVIVQIKKQSDTKRTKLDLSPMQYISERLLSSAEFILRCIDISPKAIEHANIALLQNPCALKKFVEKDINIFAHIPSTLKDNNTFMLNAIKIDWRLGQFASDRLKGLETYIYKAAHIDYRAVKHASETLHKNTRVMLKLIRIHWKIAKYALPVLFRDTQFILSAAQIDTQILSYVPPNYDSCKNAIYKIVQQSPAALRYVPEQLLDDPNFMIKIISQIKEHSDTKRKTLDLSPMQHISKRLLFSREFILRCIDISPKTVKYANIDLLQDSYTLEKFIEKDINIFAHIPGTLKNNIDFMLNAIKIDWRLGQFASNRLIGLEAYICKAAQIDYRAVKHASETLRKKEGTMLKLIRIDWKTVKYALPVLLRKTQFILSAAQINTRILNYIPLDYKDNEIFMIALINATRGPNNLRASQYASLRLKKSREFLLTAIERDPRSLQDASADLKVDTHFIYEVLDKNFGAICYLPTPLKDDAEFIMSLFERLWNQLRKAEEIQKMNALFTIQVLEKCLLIMRSVSNALTADIDFILKAHEEFTWISFAAHRSIKFNPEFIQRKNLLGRQILDCATSSLRRDERLIRTKNTGLPKSFRTQFTSSSSRSQNTRQQNECRVS